MTPDWVDAVWDTAQFTYVRLQNDSHSDSLILTCVTSLVCRSMFDYFVRLNISVNVLVYMAAAQLNKR